MRKALLATAIIVLVVFSACSITDRFDVHKIARRASVQPVFYIPVLKATFTDPLDTETKMSKTDIENLVKEKVEEVLSKIRPSLMADGGDVQLVDVEDGVVKVKLTGACAGCPMSQMTLKMGIEKLLKKEIPEVKEVVSE